MARLFVPAALSFASYMDANGEPRMAGITLAGGLYLFGPGQDRLDGMIQLDAEEQAAILAVVQTAAERHWHGMADAYAASLEEPGSNDVVVPSLAEAD